MHALILAGGEGSRLFSDGVATPKAFVDLGGRPLLFRLSDSLRRAGCESVTALVREEALGGAPLPSGKQDGPEIIRCRTPSSLHTLTRGLEAVPPGPVLCSMVDTVMRDEDWHDLVVRSRSRLERGADACVAITPFLEDERPLYVARNPIGRVTAFQDVPAVPALVTGGVYFLASRVRSLAPRVLALGVERMRGFLRWLVEHGYRVETVEVARILDVDRRQDLERATEWLGGASP